MRDVIIFLLGTMAGGCGVGVLVATLMWKKIARLEDELMQWKLLEHELMHWKSVGQARADVQIGAKNPYAE